MLFSSLVFPVLFFNSPCLMLLYFLPFCFTPTLILYSSLISFTCLWLVFILCHHVFTCVFSACVPWFLSSVLDFSLLDFCFFGPFWMFFHGFMDFSLFLTSQMPYVLCLPAFSVLCYPSHLHLGPLLEQNMTGCNNTHNTNSIHNTTMLKPAHSIRMQPSFTSLITPAW